MKIDDFTRGKIGRRRRIEDLRITLPPSSRLTPDVLENSMVRIEIEPRIKPKTPRYTPEMMGYGDADIDNELVSMPLALIADERDRIQVAFRLEDKEIPKVCSFWLHKNQIKRGNDPSRFLLPRWLLKAKLLEAMEKGLISDQALFTDCPFTLFT